MSRIDWGEKAEKTPAERRFDELCKKYKEKFGISFGYNIGGYIPRTIEDAIREVEECIRTGTPQKHEPQNIPGAVY